MRRNLIIFLSISILALAGCGSSDNKKSYEQSGGLLSGLSGQKFYESDDLDACELLSMDMVLNFSDGVPESDIEQMDIYGCNYSWDKPDAEEIEARNNDKLIAAGFTNIANLDLESEESSISLYYTDSFLPTTEEAIESVFRSTTNQLSQEEIDANNAVLRDAFSSFGTGNETDDQIQDIAEDSGLEEVIGDGLNEEEQAIGNSFLDIVAAEQAKDIYVEVSGVGDRAAWSDYSGSLVVQYNNFMFTVTAELDQNSQESAIQIAKQILDKLEKQL